MLIGFMILDEQEQVVLEEGMQSALIFEHYQEALACCAQSGYSRWRVVEAHGPEVPEWRDVIPAERHEDAF